MKNLLCLIGISLLLFSCAKPAPTTWRCKDCTTYEWVDCEQLKCKKGLRVMRFFPSKTIYLYNPKSIDWDRCLENR